jgi:hypothetical protein
VARHAFLNGAKRSLIGVVAENVATSSIGLLWGTACFAQLEDNVTDGGAETAVVILQ